MKHQQHTTIRSIGWLLAVVLGSSAAGCKLDWDFAYDAEGITPGNVAPVLTEITPIATPGNNSTPEYTFHSTQAGSISYGGDCTSPSSSAVAGDNTVQFAFLNDGVYSNCEITVSNSAGQATLAVTLFVVDQPLPAQIWCWKPQAQAITPHPPTSTALAAVRQARWSTRARVVQ